MTIAELQSMTVLQLRKLARDQHVVLGAGVDKSGIVAKIASSMGLHMSPEQQSFLPPLNEEIPQAAAPSPAREETDAGRLSGQKTAAGEAAIPFDSAADRTAAPSGNETPAEIPFSAGKAGHAETVSVGEKPVPAKKTEKPETPEPRFQAAWHSPDSPQAPAHNAWQTQGAARSWSSAAAPAGTDARPSPLRPRSFGPRFGPSSSAPAPSPMVPAAPAVPAAPSESRPVSAVSEHRTGFTGGGFGPRAAMAPTDAPAVPTVPIVSPAPAETVASLQETISPVFADASSAPPTLEELLANGDFQEGSGILELHPDGYGFLRSVHFMPSSRDIYVSMAQIRRFSLRTGDMICGKVRPQREGDKYAALLYIDTVNGVPVDELVDRPFFDELTAVYPTRKISLESTESSHASSSLRLIDLIAPLGFGQRALLLCPPGTGKRELLAEYARVISGNYPDVEVMILLIDMNPEDVTAYRATVPCPVLASTFDQAPEAHLRLTEMVLERAMRQVEQKKDVVILADSLTRLAKIYTSAAAAQGRSVPGMVNPASLLRAKRLFGAARSMREGGSLTVIAAMDIQTGNRVDDSIVEEFKGTANMELLLDMAAARAGIQPPVNLQRSFTKNTDILLNDQQKEGLSLMRQMLGSISSVQAVPQLISMMEKAPTNADLLMKMKDWFLLMSQSKA